MSGVDPEYLEGVAYSMLKVSGVDPEYLEGVAYSMLKVSGIDPDSLQFVAHSVGERHRPWRTMYICL